MNQVLPILAALVLSMPIAAARANDSKPIVTDTVMLLNPVTLAGTHLPAGTYSVKANDSKVTLSAGGKVVVESPGVVHSRDRLLDRVWGMSYPGGTRTVDVHVGQLRRKLGRPELIRTVRGAGYKAVTP